MLNINKVEALIKEKGWNKTYFCKLFGRSRTWIEDWKRDRGVPEGALLEQIADKLDTTVDYLTDKTDIKNKPAAEIGNELNGAIKRLLDITADFTDEEIRKLEEYAELLANAQRKK